MLGVSSHKLYLKDLRYSITLKFTHYLNENGWVIAYDPPEFSVESVREGIQ